MHFLNRRMQRLIAADLLPERAGQPVKAWAHVSLADLLMLDGSSALLEEWTARVRAQWAAHRAGASFGGGDGAAWLDGDAACAAACDASVTPVVTGACRGPWPASWSWPPGSPPARRWASGAPTRHSCPPGPGPSPGCPAGSAAEPGWWAFWPGWKRAAVRWAAVAVAAGLDTYPLITVAVLGWLALLTGLAAVPRLKRRTLWPNRTATLNPRGHTAPRMQNPGAQNSGPSDRAS